MQQAAHGVFCSARRILRRLVFKLRFSQGFCGLFESCPLRSKTLVFPGFFAYWANCFGYLCLSMHVHACRCCVVSCAALDPGESSSESPESFQNPHFSRENLLFCSGGAGFELGEFESYWYSMLEQRCRECSRRPSIQGASAEIAYHSNH